LPGTETVLESIVKAPAPVAPDNNRPQDVESSPSEIAADARIFPFIVDPPLTVAELPTYHHTLDALAPPARTIVLATAVVSVDEGAWNTQTALALPPASSVSTPVTPIDEFVAEI
jgi:hypothetical protein